VVKLQMIFVPIVKSKWAFLLIRENNKGEGV